MDVYVLAQDRPELNTVDLPKAGICSKVADDTHILMSRLLSSGWWKRALHLEDPLSLVRELRHFPHKVHLRHSSLIRDAKDHRVAHLEAVHVLSWQLHVPSVLARGLVALHCPDANGGAKSRNQANEGGAL